MIPEKPDNVEEFEDDINTTAPQAEPAGWQMPEPVFRRTSGKLPQGFEKREDEIGAVTLVTESEQTADSTSSTPEPSPKSPALKIVVVALAVAAMIAFLIVFLTLVYFMFFRWNVSD